MMKAGYRAQDENGDIFDYSDKPDTRSYGWSTAHLYEFISDGKPNPNWETACFDLSVSEPVIIDGILRAPVSVRYDINRTPEQFDEHLRETSCTGQDRKHGHYFKDVSNLDVIDVYRIIDLWKITDPCNQHALKKILCPGERGHKDIIQDTQDVIDTMQRKLEMFSENVK